jgi:hypothetical protein
VTEERTPPAGSRLPPQPPRPEAPVTLASVYNLLAGVAGQIAGLRGDVDSVEGKVDDVLRLQLPAAPPSSVPPASAPPSSEVIFIPKLPSPESLTPVPESRPSMAAKAAQAAKSSAPAIGKRILKGAGWLMLVGQAVAFLGRPELGPAVEALKVIGGAMLQIGKLVGGLQ